MRATTTEAIDLMRRFAERTGVADPSGGRRYLWTDAFAVCNWLGLAAATGDATFTGLARELVGRVHRVLGRHRPDDARTGWLGDASEAHPTRGGLRIGKPLPERPAGEPMDGRLEWDRDGQYFHYLTKWMHALDRMARATGEPADHLWACELAATAHRAFVHPARGAGRRVYWKMSIDLSRPLVASMGQHDPLDGWITSIQLATVPPGRTASPDAPDLRRVADDLHAMVADVDLVTADPLGLGGLLGDACRVAQLMREGADFAGERLLEALLAAAAHGLEVYARSGDWRLPPAHRLAFRELGVVIGLAAVDWLRAWDGLEAMPSAVPRLLDGLARYARLGDEILACWRTPAHHATDAWSGHRDINEVMLATSLAPEGFLVLAQAA